MRSHLLHFSPVIHLQINIPLLLLCLVLNTLAIGLLCPMEGFSIYQQLSHTLKVLQETFSGTSPCVRPPEDMRVLQLV